MEAASSHVSCYGINGWKLQIIKRKQRAFEVIGLTWIVERTLHGSVATGD